MRRSADYFDFILPHKGTSYSLPICPLFGLFFFFLSLHISFFLAELGLHCFGWAFSSCSEQGLLCIAMWLHIVVVSSVAEHRL